MCEEGQAAAGEQALLVLFGLILFESYAHRETFPGSDTFMSLGMFACD